MSNKRVVTSRAQISHRVINWTSSSGRHSLDTRSIRDSTTRGDHCDIPVVLQNAFLLPEWYLKLVPLPYDSH